MMLWFFSNTGKAIAWSALDSLWQWGILWLSYSLLVRAKGFEKPAIRYNLALLHYFTGVVLFILYFFAHCTGIPSFSLRDISFPDVEQIGHSDQFLPALNFFLGVVYLLTGAIRFSRIMVGLHHIRKMKSDGEPIQNTWISNLANEWQHKIGVPTPIHLWMSNKINGPLTTGFLKPVIFFPFCVVTNLSSIELETLLLHELMHVKRHDYFLNITVQLAQCLLFFNPFSDQLVKEIETERELEVDDLVIGSIHNPFSYATALHSVQQAYGHSRLTMNAATGEQQLLLMRIKRILKQPSEKASFNPKPFFLPVLAGILLWVIISIPPQRITVAKNNATYKIEQVIKLTAQGKGSSSANPVKTQKTSQRLLAVTAIQKRSETKSIRQSPANIAEAMAEEKFIRVKANGPIIASTFSVNKEDRSFTYESNAKDNSANPLLSPEEPFIPSNSFEKGKEAYSETAGNKNANAAAYRERMEQVRLLSVLLERIQHASSREEKIQLMQQWSKEMKKRKNSPPVKIKKIVVL